MLHDLNEILRSWPFEPGTPHVRLVQLEDGRTVVQVRLELGIIQMEGDGRPDGLRPRGSDSWLEAVQGGADAQGTEPAVRRTLDGEERRELRREAMQMLQRASALAVVADHARVARDAAHALRAMDLCAAAGPIAEGADLERHRGQAILMRVRAEAAMAVAAGSPDAALRAVSLGILEIERHLAQPGDSEPGGTDEVLLLLQMMRRAFVPRLGMGPRAELEVRLQSALATENYRLAALLRDEIRLMDSRREP